MRLIDVWGGCYEAGNLGKGISMRKLVVVLCGILASALVAGTEIAKAGPKYSYPVSVGSDYVYGSLGTARNSADGNQAIGCTTSGQFSNGVGYNMAFCSATDSQGRSASCWVASNAGTMAQSLASLGTDSLLYFTFDASGNCTFIYVENYSYFEPKNP